MKKYNTKKRKTERLKWQLLLSLTGVAVVIIAVAYIATITPVQAQRYDLTIGGWKQPENAEMSLSEHVWKLLTEEAGLSTEEALTGLMIINLESNWNPYAIGDNGLSHGLWQIHEPSHPEVTRECKFDVYCSTRAAVKIYRDWGNSWTAWSTYNKYLR